MFRPTGPRDRSEPGEEGSEFEGKRLVASRLLGRPRMGRGGFCRGGKPLSRAPCGSGPHRAGRRSRDRGGVLAACGAGKASRPQGEGSRSGQGRGSRGAGCLPRNPTRGAENRACARDRPLERGVAPAPDLDRFAGPNLRLYFPKPRSREARGRARSLRGREAPARAFRRVARRASREAGLSGRRGRPPNDPPSGLGLSPRPCPVLGIALGMRARTRELGPLFLPDASGKRFGPTR